MPVVVGKVETATSSFPQKGNPPFSKRAADIVEFTGGKNRPSRLIQAKGSYIESVQTFNSYCWKFNRMEQDIDLASDLVAGTPADYPINSDFMAPKVVHVVDANGREVRRVRYIPWERWKRTWGSWQQSSASSAPLHYTFRNPHEDGYITLDYPLDTAALQYPTMRMNYFRWIVEPTQDSDKLNVPRNVEQSIFRFAVALHVEKTKGAGTPDARSLVKRGEDARDEMLHQYQDFPDYSIYGGWGMGG